eukprot:1987332-Prymnesium_polylepis.1
MGNAPSDWTIAPLTPTVYRAREAPHSRRESSQLARHTDVPRFSHGFATTIDVSRQLVTSDPTPAPSHHHRAPARVMSGW